jgi:MerR family transcriptional regulator, Zn(II)-responsive regulator of zntA
MNLMKLLTSADLMKAAGVGRETLRFYEEKGLIKPMSRTAAGYRKYAPATVELIAFIKDTQRAGFTLKEIEELLALRATAMNSCSNVGEVLTRKLAKLDDEIADLQRKRSIVQALSDRCCASPSRNQTCALLPPVH